MKMIPPLNDQTIEQLRAGDRVTITGVIYTARDAAHKRLVEALERGEPLPIPLEGQIIYYMGPSPARPGRPI
ncbi:MAG: fumarate hydratase C-terminal domain-containing protein, partial [Dehalococcoidia bacterium]|nr:fumarate hydratase C-terminal domain-containing protein [Dehalococcoidia bacterium]